MSIGLRLVSETWDIKRKDNHGMAHSPAGDGPAGVRALYRAPLVQVRLNVAPVALTIQHVHLR